MNRGFVLVDADRFDELNAFVWSVSGRDGKHAARGDGKRTLQLHHAVLGILGHAHIDHKDGNGLDCRKSNLRIADNSLNHACYATEHEAAAAYDRAAIQYSGEFAGTNFSEARVS